LGLRSRRTCICASHHKRRPQAGRIIPTVHELYYYAYIVASRSLTLYIGMTRDLERRVFEHKCKLYDGFSADYNCNRLLWFERFAGPEAAIRREKQLKGWTRAKKIALIKRANPTWIDLSEDWYTPEQRVWLER
jgi:putative endonuclease